MFETWLGVITEQWRGGCYVIDFKVGQSFGEPQGLELDCSRSYVLRASMRRVTNSQASTRTCVESCSSGCSRRLLRQTLIGLPSVQVKPAVRSSPAAPKSRTIHALPSALRLHSCTSTSS